MKKQLRKNEQRGITLIALIVTIIVLLILAAISLTMLSGDNSVLQRAAEAKEETDKAQIRERIDLAVSNIYLSGNMEVNYETLNSALNDEFGPGNYDINPKSANVSEWTVTVEGANKTVKGKAIEGDKFYVYHSATATVTEHNIEDYKQEDGSYKFNIVELTKNKWLYGGYYSDYGKKGEYNIANPQAGAFGETYLGDRTSWNIDNAYKTSGKNIVPIKFKYLYIINPIPHSF